MSFKSLSDEQLVKKFRFVKNALSGLTIAYLLFVIFFIYLKVYQKLALSNFTYFIPILFVISGLLPLLIIQNNIKKEIIARNLNV